MDTTQNTNANDKSNRNLIGSTVRDILRESSNRRVMIRKTSGKKVIDCSLLLAMILSIGAPVLPAIVILGVFVESISVSIEKRGVQISTK